MDSNRLPSSTRRATLRLLGGGTVAALAGPSAGVGQTATPTADASLPVLFIQGFGAGRFAPADESGGAYALTLSRGVGWTLYFTDRPARLAGVIPTERFLATLTENRADPPNAAIVSDRTGGTTEATPTIWVVTLLAGAYDPAAGELTHQARIVKPSDPGMGRFPLTPAAPPSAPRDLGAGHLFVDPYNYNSVKPVNSNIVQTRG